MPRQELYNDGSFVRTQPGREMQSNPGHGVSIDSAALIGAVRAPLLDDSGAIAQGRASAAMGQGIAGIGSELLDLERTAARARNLTDVSEAMSLMDVTGNAIASEIAAQPDSREWMGIAQKHLTEAPAQWLGKKNLSLDAKDEIEARTKSWQMRTLGDIRTSAAKQAITDAGDHQKAIMMRSTKLLDKDTAIAAANSRYQLGVTSEAQYEAELNLIDEGIEHEKKVQRAESFNAYKLNTIEIAKTMPPDEVAKAIEGGIFPDANGEEKEYLKNVAASVARDGHADIVNRFNEMMAGDAIWTEAGVDAEFGASPFMTTALRKQMVDDIKANQGEEAKAARREIREGPKGVENFYRAYADADNWKPDMKTDEGKGKAMVEYANRKAWIRENVGVGMQAAVNRILDKKFGATSGARKPGEKTPATEVVRDRIARIFKDDRAAADKYLETVVSGKQGPTDDGYKIAQRRIDGVVADQFLVDKGMDEFFDANPEATETQAIEHLNTLLPEAKRVRRLESGYGERGDIGPGGAEGVAVKEFVEAPDLSDNLPQPLQPYANDFIEAGREFGINPKVLAAISMLETDSGRSAAFRNKNNAMGISNSKGPTAQASVRDSIFKMARGLSKSDGYYAKAKTIDEIGAIYAPPGAGNDPHGTNSGWASGVKAHLKRL